LDRFETLSRLKKIDFIKKAKRVYPLGMISKEYDFYKSPKGTVKSILYKKELKNRNNMSYNDKCTLIINGLSMSASVLMASWFKETQRGEIIGSPCYGSQAGTHGNPASVFLKYSGLPVSISTLILSPENINKERTGDLKMDQKIQFSLQDIKSGNDPFKNHFIQD
jgi:C-terminal processing protease CtpA/Prc